MLGEWLKERGLNAGYKFGGYEIVRSLGHGGMGHVVLAIDTTLDREVAIKFLYENLLDSEGAREAFLREARALARLSHPNVVSIHGAGEHEGAPYLVMEYIPGQSLQDLVDSGGALGVSEALWILDQVGRGLSAVHAAGLIHRDVKAENVFVGPGRRAVLGDLGIARLPEELADDQQSWGTPAYMAPETRFGSEQPATARRADVFSFGVLSYFLLAGHLPFNEIVAGLRAPEALSSLRKSIGPAADSVIAKALACDVDERTPSVDEVRRSLRSSLRSRLIEAAPRRVVIADDDPYYRESASLVIAGLFPETEVVSVADGRAALAAFSSEDEVDLLVTDLDMPAFSGADLIREIRDREELADPAIILMSAVASGTDWNLLRSQQVDGFLPKPFEPAHLQMLAQAVLEGRLKPSWHVEREAGGTPAVTGKRRRAVRTPGGEPD